jgi:hypothetical protein
MELSPDPGNALAGRRLWVRAGQQALIDPPDPAVAFAGCLFEASSVDHRNAPAALLNEPCRLQRARHHAHRGALHPQHFSQKLVGQGQGVLISPVVHAEDPAAAAGFHHMNRIAGDGLEGLGEQGLAVAHDQLPEVGRGVPDLVQVLEGDARGVPDICTM